MALLRSLMFFFVATVFAAGVVTVPDEARAMTVAEAVAQFPDGGQDLADAIAAIVAANPAAANDVVALANNPAVSSAVVDALGAGLATAQAQLQTTNPAAAATVAAIVTASGNGALQAAFSGAGGTGGGGGGGTTVVLGSGGGGGLGGGSTSPTKP